MNTAQLECFVRVAEALSFHQAAMALHISQPAVSKQVAALEDELGARLFIRTTRTVTLTPAGQLFLPDAHSMLRLAHHARQAVAETERSAGRTLRIGYLDPCELELLTGVLGGLKGLYPDFSPHFTLTPGSSGISLLENGQLDVCFAIKDRRNRDKLGFLPLSTGTMACVLSERHPLAECAFIRGAQLRDEPQVGIIPYFARGRSPSGRRAVSHLRGAGEERTALCGNSAEARCLVLNGTGYCLLPRYLAVQLEGLRAIDCDVRWSLTHGVYSRKDDASELLGDYLNLLQEACL